jgi:hypothetical protein
MKATLLHTILLIIAGTSLCCGETLLGPDRAPDASGTFESLWSEFDQYYALFGVRRINWDSLGAAYRPRIAAITDDRQLYVLLADLLGNLDDAHVTLHTPYGSFVADREHDDSSAIIERGLILYNYLGGRFDTAGEGRIYHGRIDDSIGYMQITTFQGPIEIAPGLSRWALDIDRVIESLDGAKGVIIDIRGNDGGNTFNALHIASRFADAEHLYLTTQSRSGPSRDEFTEPLGRTVAPAGPRQYKGPVVLLTNGRSVSSAEWFALAMTRFPNVTVIGDTTAGSLSGRMERELPNGWRYSIPVHKILTPEGVSYEGRGIPPDIAIRTTRQDIVEGRDPILERGVEMVR